MLEFIRKKSTSTAVLFIFGIIILVFVFWGFNPGGPSANKQNAVATVNGMSVSAEAYENTYKRELERVKSQIGGTLTPEIIESLDLRRRALDMLISWRRPALTGKRLQTRRFRNRYSQIPSFIRTASLIRIITSRY
jgi:hypothetical protein